MTTTIDIEKYPSYKWIGEKIFKLRKKQGLTMSELAAKSRSYIDKGKLKFRLSSQLIEKYENGKVKKYSLNVIDEISYALGFKNLYEFIKND